MKNKKIKVIYISGPGRSGSTLIDNVLNSIEGITSIGEASFLWQRGILENRKCGCTKRFDQCSFWRNVLKGCDFTSLHGVVGTMTKFSKFWSIDKFLLLAGYRTKNVNKAAKIVERLYLETANISGDSVIVDSSKWPVCGYIAGSSRLIEVYTIHLTRDFRGVLYSWKKKKKYDEVAGSNKYIKRQGVIRSFCEWVYFNLATEYLVKNRQHVFVRYEDFAKNPNRVINGALQHFKIKKELKLKGNSIVLQKNHCVSGNPIRFKRGKTEIVLDDEWKNKQGKIEKMLVKIITLPLFYYYKYNE